MGIELAPRCYNREFMVQWFLVVLGALRVFFRSRSDTALEILALRQQVAVLKRQRPRPPLNSGDRFCWTTLRRFWSRWTDVLLIVKPETVVGWHRAGFRLYWRWRLVRAAADRGSPSNYRRSTGSMSARLCRRIFLERWPSLDPLQRAQPAT